MSIFNENSRDRIPAYSTRPGYRSVSLKRAARAARHTLFPNILLPAHAAIRPTAQKKSVEDVEALEQRTTEADATISAAPARKQALLDNFPEPTP